MPAEHASAAAQVKLHSLSDDAVAAIWARFHAAIEPARAVRSNNTSWTTKGSNLWSPEALCWAMSYCMASHVALHMSNLHSCGVAVPVQYQMAEDWLLVGLQAGKLGCVMFQFHLSFAPTQASRAHVEWCREKLRQDVAMAVEFRNRAWFKETGALAETQVGRWQARGEAFSVMARY